ncbi:sialidase family protein (plasmid) [Edwardsiella tarda]|uniref:sialidase family protein n=1 Tax=Edwardsiella tarda TaxID=636 RepID=UPI0024441BEA|nr:sialidase family protein [Edwardsiella tarda]WGE30894.1 sialidase family protein [Edwardsiella tarda]
MKTHKLLIGCLVGLSPLAHADLASPMANNGWDSAEVIFSQHNRTHKNGWRIPAITRSNGDIIAVSDARENGTSDIGINTDVHFGYRLSHDQGTTWGPIHDIIPNLSGKHQISDPAIVYNPNTGRTFLAGFYNDRFIINKSTSDKADFFMFTSDNGGLSWDKGVSLHSLAPAGYKYILQGPGSGMYYKGTVYLAAQAWHNDKDKQLGGATSTSGFIYSADNGKTWRSAWLRPSSLITDKKPGSDGLPDITSESTVFHHDGYIYLSAKPETSREKKGRVVYRTMGDGQHWERVTENFIPDNIARAESSTLSLNDQVYLVGYSKQSTRASRDGIYITSNTGRTVQVYDKPTYGYSSMTQDNDNLYILFEGQGDIFLHRYDLASRDYANLAATILDRSNDLFYIQHRLRQAHSYVQGSYGSRHSAGGEFLYAGNGARLGFFYTQSDADSQHAAGTIKYSTKNTTLTMAKDSIFLPTDNVFVGYQHSDIHYVNNASNHVNSLLMGYSYPYTFGPFTYEAALTGIYSSNNFSRNHQEGLGRTANFTTYSVALKNTLSVTLPLTHHLTSHIESGLQTTLFHHAAFSEQGGNGWNNATLQSSTQQSNQLFLEAALRRPFTLHREDDLSIAAKINYQYTLSDSNKWAERSTVLDVQRTLAAPVRRYKAGLATGTLVTSYQISTHAQLSADTSVNTAGDKRVRGLFSYTF